MIIKLGRYFEKVRDVLRDPRSHAPRAYYVERATMHGRSGRRQLDEVDPESVPYFSMIVVPSGRRLS